MIVTKHILCKVNAGSVGNQRQSFHVVSSAPFMYFLAQYFQSG